MKDREQRIKFLYETVNKDGYDEVPDGMCIIRRDFLRKLKKRTGNVMNAKAVQRSSLFSTGNEVAYFPVNKPGESKKYLKDVRHFLCDDTTQDPTQAYAQMIVTHDWLVKEKKAKMIYYWEDGATTQ